MKVLITGCSRSGTTMLINIMPYFYNSEVILDDEVHPYKYLEFDEKGKVFVIKKPLNIYESQDWFDMTYLIHHGWKIIWLIRDGRDVVCSKNEKDEYHTDCQRWVQTNQEFMRVAENNNVLPIHYERFVKEPEKQMQKISEFLGANFQQDFNDFYLNVNPKLRMNVGVEPRKIDADSIGNFIKHPKRIAQIKKSKFYQLFTVLNTIFGYE